ncbi:uncharacterized protein A4U43_C08F9740 [Asparagus officinalis]|nr:uncharacterized protein A4U43_C08F9740 [Asparagus officinalis]
MPVGEVALPSGTPKRGRDDIIYELCSSVVPYASAKVSHRQGATKLDSVPVFVAIPWRVSDSIHTGGSSFPDPSTNSWDSCGKYWSRTFVGDTDSDRSVARVTNTLETIGPYGATPLRSEDIPARANWVFTLTKKEKKRIRYRKDFLQEHRRTTYIKDGS